MPTVVATREVPIHALNPASILHQNCFFYRLLLCQKKKKQHSDAALFQQVRSWTPPVAPAVTPHFPLRRSSNLCCQLSSAQLKIHHGAKSRP